MKREQIFWLGIFGVLFFVITTILAGTQFAGYSHVTQLISESYAIGTPYGIYLRCLGFIPSGLLLAAFSFAVVHKLPKSIWTKIGFYGIGLFYGLGTVIVSLFPCDEGCNKELIDPSVAQLIHNMMGFLTYTIVPVCVLILGIDFKGWLDGKTLSYFGKICGLTAILFVAILFSDLQSAYLGLYQRIIEGAILSWIVAVSFYVRNATRNK